MPKKTPLSRIETLLSPSLEETLDPHALIALIPINTDHIIADIGCGPGLLTIPLAKYLYRGRVYAVDIEKEMHNYVMQSAKVSHLNNIKTILSKETEVPISKKILDGVVLCDVLNEAKRPKILIQEAARLLKPSGWVSVVDWLPTDTKARIGPPKSRRIPQKKIVQYGESSGLHPITNRMIGNERYIVLFKKH